MKKIFLILGLFVSIFAHALFTLDAVTGDDSFASLEMLSDSEGNTYVFWVEVGGEFSQAEETLKWAYKPINGSFGEAQTLGEASSPIRFNAAINGNQDVSVVWVKDDTTQDSMKRSGDDDFTTQEAFSDRIGFFKLKAAPNNSFFLIASNKDGDDRVFQWSERTTSSLSFSDFRNVIPAQSEKADDTDGFDFEFDDQSNVLFAGLFGESGGTVRSDVYVTFKAEEASDFQTHKIIPRLNDDYYTNHMNVVYNGNTNLGTTWSIFWEEASTNLESLGGVFFFRVQILNNNNANTNVVFSESVKTVYQVLDRITDQFQVYKKEDTKVLGVWGENNSDLFYTVFDIIQDSEFAAQSVSQAGINPVNIAVDITEGLSLITWNTRGQEGGDIRWGFIPSESSTFNYQYALQSFVEGMTQYAETPKVVSYSDNQLRFSWLGETLNSDGFTPQFVQTVSILPLIQGEVTDDNTDQPLANAIMELLSNGTVIDTTATDDQGSYSFNSIDVGDYSVRASKPSYIAETKNAEVTIGGRVIVNFSLGTTAGNIAGRVVDSSTDQAISGATVQLLSEGSVIRTTQTNSSGNYSFSDVGVGTYSVKATKTGYKSQEKSASVSFDQTTTVNFSLEASTSILKGVVSDSSIQQPISGATVELFFGGGLITSTKTNSSGNYFFTGLDSGSYQLKVSQKNYKNQTKTIQFSKDTIKTVNFFLDTKPGLVQGQVEDVITGKFISGATVKLFSNAGLVGQTITNTSGSYVFQGVDPGTYSVEVSKSGYIPVGKIDVQVFAEKGARANFSLTPIVGSLEGQITDSDTGLPIQNVTVQLFSNSVVIASAKTNDQGNYALENIEPGSYILKTTETNYIPFSQGISIVSGQTGILNIRLTSSASRLYKIGTGTTRTFYQK